MSRWFLVGALALAAGFAAPAARAENPFGLEVPGWSSQQAPTGTIYFTCLKPACGGKTMIFSVGRQRPMPGLTLDTFKAAQNALNAQILARAPHVRSSTLGPAMMASVKSVHIFTIQRDQVSTSGAARFYVNGFLVGPSVSLSVVSDATSRQVADANFRQMLPHLIQLAETLR